jgi:outer membrane protein OmpA-like peptidoglycan-associated protein
VPSLHILTPCARSWDAMSGGSQTRHCDACDKEVHDLRSMSDGEALAYVRARKGASLCVRMLVVTTAVAACGGPPVPAAAHSPPQVASAPASAPSRDGDRDHDGIPDALDQCPDSAEDLDGVDDTDGCPEVDADKDGIDDASDACPKEPGVVSTDAHRNGCPQFVVMESMGLVILQQVHFARASGKLMAESFPIVDETIKAMQNTPELRQVAIEGHASTDEPGAQALSEARARAVVARMVAAGIDPKRLVVHGLGASRPIEDNKTSEGRERNRRVEFRIVQQGDPQATTSSSSTAADCASSAPARGQQRTTPE